MQLLQINQKVNNSTNYSQKNNRNNIIRMSNFLSFKAGFNTAELDGFVKKIENVSYNPEMSLLNRLAQTVIPENLKDVISRGVRNIKDKMHLSVLVHGAIENKNLPLLEIIMDQRKNILQENIGSVIIDGLDSEDIAISEIFSSENLYKNYKNTIKTANLKTFFNSSNDDVNGRFKILEAFMEHNEDVLVKDQIIKQLEDFYEDTCRFEFLLKDVPLSLDARRKILNNIDCYDKLAGIKIFPYTNAKGHFSFEDGDFDYTINFLESSAMTPELLVVNPEKNSTGRCFLERFAQEGERFFPSSEGGRVAREKIANKLSKLQYIPYSKDFFNELIRLAARTGNIDFIKFCKDRHISIETIRNYEDNYSEDIDTELMNTKKPFENFEQYLTKYSGFKNALKENKYDINTRDSKGYPLLFHLIDKGAYDILYYLKTLGNEVDWNIVSFEKDKIDNIATHIRNIEDKESMLDFLSTFDSNEIDFNFINPFTNKTILQEMLEYIFSTSSKNTLETVSSHSIIEFVDGTKITVPKYTKISNNCKYIAPSKERLIDKLFSLPGLDFNKYVKGTMPPLFYAVHSDKLLDNLLKQENLDLSVTYQDKDIFEYINEIAIPSLAAEITKKLQDYQGYSIIDNAKNIYEAQGSLTLEQIRNIVSTKNFEKFMQNTITPIHGNILHCLAEINIEDKDIDSVVLILEKLKELDFYFDQKDSLDRTALDIAKTSKNEKFIDLLELSNIKIGE